MEHMYRSAPLVQLATLVTAALAADVLEPPPGVEQKLEVFADGVQVYACEAKDGKYVWAFRQPEAALFDARGRQVGTHGKGPTWSFYDGSSLTGEVIGKAASPRSGAVPWLLLAVKPHDGSGALGSVAFIRRTDTTGGVEPAEGCDVSHAGDVARMRYSATYQFLGK